MMNSKNRTPIGKPSSLGLVSTPTKADPTGQVLFVANPFDIVYLCNKMEAAYRNPYIAKNGTPRYQRQVTKWIRQDAEYFDYRFPYCGEVGYNMTKSPPEPIMSQGFNYRPTTYPLSQYRLIYREYRELNTFRDPVGPFKFEFSSFEIISPMVSKTELENTLNLKRSNVNTIEEAYRTLNPPIAEDLFKNGRGLIRIPDVIRKTNYNLVGRKGYHPDNLAMVIEVKFPNDKLSNGQAKDYLKIAGNEYDKFRLITLEQCQNRRRRKDEEEQLMADAKSDPLYIAVGEQALNNPKMILGIEELIQYEYDAISKHVIKWVNTQIEKYSRPQLLVTDNTNEQARIDAWKRYNEHYERVQAAPLAIVGIGIAGTAAVVSAVPSVTVETSAVTTVTRGGTTVLQFPTKIVTKSALVGGGATSLKLAAENNEHHYIAASDGTLRYNSFLPNEERLKNQDDRFIELDYRYNAMNIRPRSLDNLLTTSLPELNNQARPFEIHYYPYQTEYYYYFIEGEPNAE